MVNHTCGRYLQLHCHATLLAGNCGKKNITFTLSIAWPHPFGAAPIRSSRIRSDAAPISSRCVYACERDAFNLHKVVIGQSKWRTIFQIIDDTQHKDRGILSVPLTRRKPVSFVYSLKKKKKKEKERMKEETRFTRAIRVRARSVLLRKFNYYYYYLFFFH